MTAIIDQNKIPRRALYTGETIPAVGLGTFGSDKGRHRGKKGSVRNLQGMERHAR